VDELIAAVNAAAGPGRLRLVHANDSATPCGSKADRHASIGSGYIGVSPYGKMIGHPDLAGVPFIVETPGGNAGHAADIARLKRLRAEIGQAAAGAPARALC
jgi:deoxyribonuclease-4